jgi:hypothetical protein
MKYNPDKYQRSSIRLKRYDYSQVGVYFVTICVQERDRLFGKNPLNWDSDEENPYNKRTN